MYPDLPDLPPPSELERVLTPAVWPSHDFTDVGEAFARWIAAHPPDADAVADLADIVDATAAMPLDEIRRGSDDPQDHCIAGGRDVAAWLQLYFPEAWNLVPDASKPSFLIGLLMALEGGDVELP